MRDAPLPNPFFRPEEKHVVSGENNVVPPPGCGNKAMKSQLQAGGPSKPNLQIERFTGLLAAGMNAPRAFERRCGRRFRDNLKPTPSLISRHSNHRALRRCLRRRGRWRQGQCHTSTAAHHLEENTMGGAAAVDIATDDLAAFVDSVKGSKLRGRKIIDYKTMLDGLKRMPCVSPTAST